MFYANLLFSLKRFFFVVVGGGVEPNTCVFCPQEEIRSYYQNILHMKDFLFPKSSVQRIFYNINLFPAEETDLTNLKHFCELQEF